MGITAGVGALIGGVVGGGASIAGGILGSNAAGKAADVQAAAANHAADLQKQAADQALAFNKLQYGNSLNIMAPWVNTGQAANSRLGYLMGLSPNQGLPPGVVNPNAATANQGGGMSLSNLLGGGGGIGQFLAGLPNGTNPLASDPRLGNLPPNVRGGTPQPIQDGTAGGGFSANSGFVPRTGMAFDGNGLMNGGINPGNITASASPGQIPFQNPDIGTFNAGTTQAGTGSPVVANGLPGMVPRTDGGGDPNNPTAPTPGGGFGSLAQGWNQTFSSPTNVTEQNDPGFQFRLEQGQKALEASAAARGGLLSGGTAKAINDYAQNSASNEYGNVYNRALQNYQTNYNTFSNDQSNLFNRLSALSGTGQVSANQLSGAGMSSASNAGNILLGSAGQIGQQLNNAGAANASGYVGSANALGGALSGTANSLTGALSLYQLLNAQK